MLVKVLTEPQNSLLAQVKLQFAMDDVDLSLSPDALEEVAQMALERKTGARALRSIVEKVKIFRFNSELLDALWSANGRKPSLVSNEKPVFHSGATTQCENFFFAFTKPFGI